MTTIILLVRHGQTEWNRNERFRGRYDINLNEHGLEQARKTADRIAKAWKPTVVYSSPLKRAMQTAKIIAQRHNLHVLSNTGLIDIDYGEWQGLTPIEVSKKWPELFAVWSNNPENARVPGGESLIEVCDRVRIFLSKIIRLHADQTVLLVSHTVVNRLTLLSILGMGIGGFWHLAQEPCAINLIIHEQNNYVLYQMNDTCHLQNDW